MKTIPLLAALTSLFISIPALAVPTSIGVGVWEQSYSGDLIDVDGPKDTESDLALGDQQHFEASISWATQSGWIPNIRLGVFDIKTNGVNTISEAGSFDLLGIPVVTATGSADVSTRVDYRIWNSLFFYRFPWKGFDFEIGATLNYVDGTVVADVDYDSTAELSGRVDEQRKTNTETFIPTGYAAVRKAVSPWLALRANFYGATTGEDSVGQLSLLAEVKLGQDWLFYGGYRTQAIDFYDETKQTGLDVRVKGPTVGLVWRLANH